MVAGIVPWLAFSLVCTRTARKSPLRLQRPQVAGIQHYQGCGLWARQVCVRVFYDEDDLRDGAFSFFFCPVRGEWKKRVLILLRSEANPEPEWGVGFLQQGWLFDGLRSPCAIGSCGPGTGRAETEHFFVKCSVHMCVIALVIVQEL